MGNAFGLQMPSTNPSYMKKYEYILDQTTSVKFADLPMKFGFINVEIIEPFTLTNTSNNSISLAVMHSVEIGKVITSTDPGRVTIGATCTRGQPFTFPVGAFLMPSQRYYVNHDYSFNHNIAYVEYGTTWKKFISSADSGNLCICIPITGLTINTWGKMKLIITTLE